MVEILLHQSKTLLPVVWCKIESLSSVGHQLSRFHWLNSHGCGSKFPRVQAWVPATKMVKIFIHTNPFKNCNDNKYETNFDMFLNLLFYCFYKLYTLKWPRLYGPWNVRSDVLSWAMNHGSWLGMILGSKTKSFQLTFNFIVGYLIRFAWIRWSRCWCTWHGSNCFDSDFIQDLEKWDKLMIRTMDVITVMKKVTWFIMLSASSSSPDSANALSEIKIHSCTNWDGLKKWLDRVRQTLISNENLPIASFIISSVISIFIFSFSKFCMVLAIFLTSICLFIFDIVVVVLAIDWAIFWFVCIIFHGILNIFV